LAAAVLAAAAAGTLIQLVDGAGQGRGQTEGGEGEKGGEEEEPPLARWPRGERKNSSLRKRPISAVSRRLFLAAKTFLLQEAGSIIQVYALRWSTARIFALRRKPLTLAEVEPNSIGKNALFRGKEGRLILGK